MPNLIGTKLAEDVYVGDLVLYDDRFYVVAHINMTILKGRRKIMLFEEGMIKRHSSNSIKYALPESITIMDELLQRVRAGMEHFKGESIISSEYAKFLQHNIDLEFP